jgi:hypothetical protein
MEEEILQQTMEGQEQQPATVNEEVSKKMGKSMFNRPIPGQSLTQSTEKKLPYERPPEFVELEPAMQHVFLKVTDPEFLPVLVDLMTNTKMTVEMLIDEQLKTMVFHGKIHPNLYYMMIEPMFYMYMWLLGEMGVKYRLTEEEEEVMLEDFMNQEFNDDEDDLDFIPNEKQVATMADLLAEEEEEAPKDFTNKLMEVGVDVTDVNVPSLLNPQGGE